MSQSRILITASTGNVGLPLAKALKKKNIDFIAATRDAEKAKEKFGFEPETVYLDFKEENSFKAALKNIDLLFLCGPAGTPGAEKLLAGLLEEAARQDVSHVVFIASYPGLMEFIKDSDMKYTFLKANFFMQNFEMYQTEDIRDRKQIFMPTGKGKAPFIHTRDIGEVAAEVISDPGKYEGEILYLTGPAAMDHFEVAEVFSRVLGEKITYRNPDDETYRKEMKKRGYSDEYIDAMITVFGKIRRGKVKQPSDTVGLVLGRKPLSLKEYVAERKNHFTG